MRKLSDCLNLQSRNDIYEDEFFRADTYFINKKHFIASKDWNIQVDNISWFNLQDRFPVRNLTNGYHGILRQWWDSYFPDLQQINVLLAGENNDVKADFKKFYPHWDIDTTEYYVELRPDSSSADIVCDLCERNLSGYGFKEYDLILSQAIIEHVYDPLTYAINLFTMLKSGGVLMIHTVTPGFPYHAFPRDYFRFFSDWFFDLPDIIKKVDHRLDLEIAELLDLRKNLTKNSIFACYRRR